MITHTHTKCWCYLVGKAPHSWPAYEYTLGPQGHSLQHVTASTNTPIEIHLDPTLHHVHYLRQSIYLLGEAEWWEE